MGTFPRDEVKRCFVFWKSGETLSFGGRDARGPKPENAHHR